MKLRIPRESFLESLNGVSKAVANSSPLPTIEGVLIQAKFGHIMLTGYDLELGIVTEAEGEILEEGETVIKASLLINMMKKITAETVSISSDENNRIEIRGGITHYEFGGMPPHDFPELPKPTTETALTIGGQLLREMIDRTIFAAATGDQKPVHTGSKFFLGQNELTVVSVDGYRLAVCRRDIVGTLEKSFVIPAKTLAEVSRLIGENDDAVSISTARRYGVFHFGKYTVLTRLLEGDFLDYKRTIPDGWSTRVLIDRRELYESIERASLLITDRFRSPIRIKFQGGKAILTCHTSLGDTYDEMNVSQEGADLEIGFNNRYILDALRNCGCDKVWFELNGPTAPMKIFPEIGDDFVFLVLPVRIRTD